MSLLKTALSDIDSLELVETIQVNLIEYSFSQVHTRKTSVSSIVDWWNYLVLQSLYFLFYLLQSESVIFFIAVNFRFSWSENSCLIASFSFQKKFKASKAYRFRSLSFQKSRLKCILFLGSTWVKDWHIVLWIWIKYV